MTDLNVMLREQARAGLQAQLDAAVTNGDTEAATKIAADMERLAVSTAPKAPPFGDAEIRAAIEAKVSWFGVDPRKSGAAVRLGKDMNPKKFATADAFAEALIKAVDDEFKPNSDDGEDDAGDDGEDDAGDDGEAKKPAKKKKVRRTDGPGELDGGARRSPARNAGPWTKLSDAPPDVQKEIKRQADKFLRSTATKEQREQFTDRALESHYAAHQRKGKK